MIFRIENRYGKDQLSIRVASENNEEPGASTPVRKTHETPLGISVKGRRLFEKKGTSAKVELRDFVENDGEVHILLAPGPCGELVYVSTTRY
jgi:hypothetical protein